MSELLPAQALQQGMQCSCRAETLSLYAGRGLLWTCEVPHAARMLSHGTSGYMIDQEPDQ
jgi:hypothetical protein